MDKRTKIIHAAMRLLTENGVQATPMSAIVKAANTGMGTAYNYFATKEELINAIYLYIKDDEIKTIFKPFPDESIKKQFDHFFKGLAEYFVAHPDFFYFMDQFHNSPIITPETRNEGMKAMEPIVSLITKGQKQGIIKQIGIDELLQFLNGGMMAVIRWILNENKSAAKILDNQLRIAWDAIKE